MTISVLFLVGRFLLAVPFVLLGADRALAADARGAERAWALLGLLGAAGIVLGVWGDAAALVLGVAIVGSGITEGRHETTEATDVTGLRLIGLLGAAVVTAALYIAVGAALDLTVTDPLFDLDLR